MLRKKMGRKGFTLVELLIVVIIIGILAAVSVPVISANVTKAKVAEAAAAMGALRTQQRIYQSLHAGDGTANLIDLDLDAATLEGTLFPDATGYVIAVTEVASPGSDTIEITVTSKVDDITVTMDNIGKITYKVGTAGASQDFN